MLRIVQTTFHFTEAQRDKLRLNAVPAVWSALDDFRSNNFEPTFILGIHKEFSLNLEPNTHGIITLELEEV